MSDLFGAPRPQESFRLAGALRDQIFAAEKLNRLGPAVINKLFVSHRSDESQPIPHRNTIQHGYRCELLDLKQLCGLVPLIGDSCKPMPKRRFPAARSGIETQKAL
ncbi:hypothetical protein NKH94_30825 [Mesorhizobium australicum]|uniref:hypothetical protein n=1 Tax=Mesorhizobium australicum TaxID=536018 RepID=UPI003337CF7B